MGESEGSTVVAGSVEAAAPGRAESTGVTAFRTLGGATSDCGSGMAMAMMNRVRMSNGGFAQNPKRGPK